MWCEIGNGGGSLDADDVPMTINSHIVDMCEIINR